MIFADKIILLRKKNGWSQEELAEKLEVTRQSVSKWESAQSIPDIGKILILSRLFGVSTDYLLRDDMEEEDENIGAAEFGSEEAPLRRVSLEEANTFIKLKSETAGKIAFASFLCFLSPICLLILGAMSELPGSPITENMAGAIGMTVLLLFAIPAVSIFIYCGTKTASFEWMEKEPFETEYGVDGMVRERQKQFSPKHMRCNIAGTCLCILAVIPIFLGSMLFEDDFSMTLMLSLLFPLVGIGVWMFIKAGVPWGAMEILLEEGDYTKEKKRKGKRTEALGGIYWLLVTAAYLGYSLYTNKWGQSWIIWPVAGVIFAAVMIGINSFTGKDLSQR